MKLKEKLLEVYAILTPRTLNIEKRLMQLGLIKAIIENKAFESTYFNMNGERTQTYIGVNALSNLHNVLSKLNNITELSSNPAYKQYEYLRTDVFAKGSVMLQKMFNLHPTKGTGKRINGTEDLGNLYTLMVWITNVMVRRKNLLSLQLKKELFKR